MTHYDFPSPKKKNREIKNSKQRKADKNWSEMNRTN
jgi:hypothetical protein